MLLWRLRVVIGGWSSLTYNGGKNRAKTPIDEKLLLPRNYKDKSKEYIKNNRGQIAKGSKDRAVFMTPFTDIREDLRYGEGYWGGIDDLVWVSSDKMSSSRLVMKHIEKITTKTFTGANAPIKFSQLGLKAAGFQLIIYNRSNSKGSGNSEINFMDMNGDRFPDVVSSNKIQYTNMTGELGSILGKGTNIRESGLMAKSMGINAANISILAEGIKGIVGGNSNLFHSNY